MRCPPIPAGEGRRRSGSAGWPLRRKRPCCRPRLAEPCRWTARRRRYPGGVLVDGDRGRRGHSVHDVRPVRARVDAVHVAGDPVRGPDGIADGDPGHADVDRDRAEGLRAGVDAPHASTERVRRPDVGAPTASEVRPSAATSILCVIVFVRVSIFAMPRLRKSYHPHATDSRGDTRGADAAHPTDQLAGSRVDPRDGQVGIDDPHGIGRHRDVLRLDEAAQRVGVADGCRAGKGCRRYDDARVPGRSARRSPGSSWT